MRLFLGGILMQKTAFVLFGHGARDPQWADSMRRVAAALRQLLPERRVELAFLEFLEPDLLACAESLVAEGYQRLLIVPLFIAQGGHLKNDVPVLLGGLRSRYPQVVFELTPAVGEAESVIRAMAAHVATLADD